MDSEERQLSDRERTVLLLAAEGLTDKEIAKHLSLSQRTIGTYWERMRQKLGSFSRTQLVARFLRSETEVERSSESYRNLFSAWDEGVWIVSSTGKTIYANQPVAALLGRSQQSLLATDANRLLREIADLDVSFFLDGSPREPLSKEVRITKENAGARWLSFRGSPMTDRRGDISSVVLIVQDVTFHKRVRHTLDSCELSLEFLANKSGSLVVRFDESLRCVFANESFHHIGISPKICIGRTLPELAEIFQPIGQWVTNVEVGFASGETGDFGSEWTDLGSLQTHYLPEPSMDFEPRHVLCITPLPFQCLTETTPAVSTKSS